ncbi:MAG: hypothetical protein [Inoviridae sp.]|nr:MAG: hypothetical protein [Inoviridae sp.]
MDFMALLTQMIQILVGGITGVAKGIGEGLSTLVTNIFMDTSGDTAVLSVFGGLILCFAGISLAIGLGRWVVNFVTSLGSRNR